MSLFQRRKPLHPSPELPVVKSPALDAAIERLAELNREATERVDRLLAKLQKRAEQQLANAEGKPQ